MNLATNKEEFKEGGEKTQKLKMGGRQTKRCKTRRTTWTTTMTSKVATYYPPTWRTILIHPSKTSSVAYVLGPLVRGVDPDPDPSIIKQKNF